MSVINLPTPEEETKLSVLLPLVFYKLPQRQKMCERQQSDVMNDLKSLSRSFLSFSL